MHKRNLKIYLISIAAASTLMLWHFYASESNIEQPAEPGRQTAPALTSPADVSEQSKKSDDANVAAEQNVTGVNEPSGISHDRPPREKSRSVAETVEFLIASAVDPNEPDRQQALDALVALGARAVDPLMATITDSGAGLFNKLNKYVPTEDVLANDLSLEPERKYSFLKAKASIEVLIRMGPPAIEPLLAFIRGSGGSGYFSCHEHVAAYVLGEIGDRLAVPKLIEALAAESANSLLRYRVGLALGKIGDERALTPLLEMLISEDYRDPQTARKALAFMGAPAVEELILLVQNPDKEIRLRAINTLSGIKDDRAAEPLMPLLDEDDKDIRKAAITALGHMKAEASIDALIANLGHEDINIRSAAARALGRIGEPVLEPLLIACKDEDEHVREHSVQALGDIGGDRAVESLMDALRDREHWVRLYAARGLGKIGDPKATDVLIKTLENKYKDKNFRGEVAMALGRIGDRRAVELLVSNLDSPETTLRRACAYSLGEIGDAKAIEPLTAKLPDWNGDVRQAVAIALDKLNYEPGTPIEKAIYRIAKKDFSGCVELGGPAVAPLVGILLDSEPYHRVWAAEALGKIGDRRAVVPLIDCLNSEIKESRRGRGGMATGAVLEGTVVALGQIGDRRAFEPLVTLLTEQFDGFTPINRALAVRILGQMKDPRAIPALVVCLRNRTINADAVEALKSIGWQPGSTEDTVHLHVAQGDFEALKENWPQAKEVLLSDVQSGDTATINNAVVTFIQIGDEAVLQDLIDIMNDNGNSRLASVYLNCGKGELEAVATKWAHANGYKITRMPGVNSVSWGQKR